MCNSHPSPTSPDNLQATNAGLRDINAAIHYEHHATHSNEPISGNAVFDDTGDDTHAQQLAQSSGTVAASQPPAASPPAPWHQQEAWSELLVHVDGTVVPLVASNRRVRIRCTANIYELYRGAASDVVHVMDENFWVTGGKVSPTIDQRGGASANRGDPDNSALTGGAAAATTATAMGALFGGGATGSWKWCGAVLMASVVLSLRATLSGGLQLEQHQHHHPHHMQPASLLPAPAPTAST